MSGDARLETALARGKQQIAEEWWSVQSGKSCLLGSRIQNFLALGCAHFFSGSGDAWGVLMVGERLARREIAVFPFSPTTRRPLLVVLPHAPFAVHAV